MGLPIDTLSPWQMSTFSKVHYLDLPYLYSVFANSPLVHDGHHWHLRTHHHHGQDLHTNPLPSRLRNGSFSQEDRGGSGPLLDLVLRHRPFGRLAMSPHRRYLHLPTSQHLHQSPEFPLGYDNFKPRA